jgi:hypothetical protein
MNVRACMVLYCWDNCMSTRVSEDVSDNQSKVGWISYRRYSEITDGS